MKLPKFNEETSVKMIIALTVIGLLRFSVCLLSTYYFKKDPCSSNGMKNSILLYFCSIIIIILLTK